MTFHISCFFLSLVILKICWYFYFKQNDDIFWLKIRLLKDVCMCQLVFLLFKIFGTPSPTSQEFDTMQSPRLSYGRLSQCLENRGKADPYPNAGPYYGKQEMSHKRQKNQLLRLVFARCLLPVLMPTRTITGFWIFKNVEIQFF